MVEEKKRNDYVNIVVAIVEHSTIIPFKWCSNKFTCFFCSCPFEAGSLLIEHYRQEHPEPKVRKIFRNIIKKSKIKFEITEMKCKLCSVIFETIDTLLQHFVMTHNLKLNLNLRENFFCFKINDERMLCHQCGDEFRSFCALLTHTHLTHNNSEVYLCEICGRGFIDKKNVAAHVKVVHSRKNCKCPKCNVVCKNYNALQSHNRKKHSSLKCPKCPEVFRTQYLRKKHLATVHDMKKYQYECDICNKMFTLRDRVIAHKLRVHLKEKKIYCEYCPYRAFDKEALNKHMVCHTDARPFQCEFCKKSFQRKKNCELHRRIHTNDRRYVCKECGKAFVQCTSLKLHYRVHHNKDGS